jgi:hypothetical protein
VAEFAIGVSTEYGAFALSAIIGGIKAGKVFFGILR